MKTGLQRKVSVAAMSARLLCAISAFFLLTFAGNLHAASFDCSKATSEVEKIICGDDELSKLDQALNKAYLQALKRTDMKKRTIENQRLWLKNERNACKDAECLKKAYQTRITELKPCRTIPRISANSAHGVVLAANCTVWMWGFNNAGQLARKPKSDLTPKNWSRF